MHWNIKTWTINVDNHGRGKWWKGYFIKSTIKLLTKMEHWFKVNDWIIKRTCNKTEYK